MFIREYKVKGEDVNDFMVMQNEAYLKYTSKILETFLYVKGYTKLKMNSLKIGLQNRNSKLKQFDNLFFTQNFTIVLEFRKIDTILQKMEIVLNFYNKENSLITTIERDFFWFDYNILEVIAPPKVISKHFLMENEFRNVG
jgi:acyl-CoA thioesterase FadM